MAGSSVILQEWPSFPKNLTREGTFERGKLPFCGRVPSWEALGLEKGRQSAVVVVCTEAKGRECVICVERSASMRRHAGQLAFPGGVREPQDFSPVETAFRECYEELGLPPEKFRLKGALPKEYAYSSDFVIYPFVAEISCEEIDRRIEPDPVELHSAFLVRLESLKQPPELYWGSSVRGSFMYPVFRLDGKRSIWGATARILWRFLRSPEAFRGAIRCP